MASDVAHIHETDDQGATASRSAATWLLPGALVVLLALSLLYANPAVRLGEGAPPTEDVAFEHVRLSDHRVELLVRNVGTDPLTIAQVLVHDAYWMFEISPSNTLTPRQSATITLQYPWVEGEPIVVMLLTESGATFEHEIPIAMASPVPTTRTLLDYAWVGLLVGFLPVAAGMALFPAMTRMRRSHHDALLAFTLGVLGFLALDALVEGLELAEAASLGGVGLLFAAALAALLGVLWLDRWLRGRSARSGAGAGGVALAVLIALGIGLHNLGEGLLIGSAFALGSLGLGTALIAGFAIHNVTEGPAIVSPLTRGGSLPWGRFLLLAGLAGLPTVVGAWLGAFTSTSLLAVVFFGLGLGAIVVVLAQVGRAIRREGRGLTAPVNVVAFVLGYLVMLVTGILVGS